MEGRTKRTALDLALAILLTDGAAAPDDRVRAFNFMHFLGCSHFLELKSPSTAVLMEVLKLQARHPEHPVHLIYAGKESERDLGSVTPEDLVRCLKVTSGLRVVIHLRGALSSWWRVAVSDLAGSGSTLELGLVSDQQEEVCKRPVGLDDDGLNPYWPRGRQSTPIPALLEGKPTRECYQKGCPCRFFVGPDDAGDGHGHTCGSCAHPKSYHSTR